MPTFVFGQIGNPAPDVKKLLAFINDGIPLLHDLSAAEMELKPLSWAISVNSTRMTEDFFGDHSDIQVIDVVHEIAKFLGPGTYYIRGLPERYKYYRLDSFWDTNPAATDSYGAAMEGVPLSFTYAAPLSTISIYYSWVQDFVEKNTLGRSYRISDENEKLEKVSLESVFRNVSGIYSFYGPWQIQMVHEAVPVGPCN